MTPTLLTKYAEKIDNEFCLRCGMDKVKPYGGCSSWGTHYKRHLWSKPKDVEFYSISESLIEYYRYDLPKTIALDGYLRQKAGLNPESERK